MQLLKQFETLKTELLELMETSGRSVPTQALSSYSVNSDYSTNEFWDSGYIYS